MSRPRLATRDAGSDEHDGKARIHAIQIETQYPGRCMTCGGHIGAGEHALWYRKSRKLQHRECGERPVRISAPDPSREHARPLREQSKNVRVIHAKYPTTCATCRERIQKDKMVNWYPTLHKLEHQRCPQLAADDDSTEETEKDADTRTRDNCCTSSHDRRRQDAADRWFGRPQRKPRCGP